VSETSDEHLERLCRGWTALARALALSDSGDVRADFDGWLAERDIDPAHLRWTADGALRLTLPASRFTAAPARPGRKGTFALIRLGSYVTPRSHVLQLWCDDPRLRREAVLERALTRVVAARHPAADDAEAFLARLCTQLETTPVTLDDLRRHAHKTGQGPLPV
jgi:hypothetical protein